MVKLSEKSKPYVAMISLQFGYAGMNIMSKVSFNRGMNHFVLVVYSNAAATVVLAPFALGWDINLLTAVYSGVMGSAIAYYVQGLCIRLKGPVFATAFSPLSVIIIAIMGPLILSEKIFLGSMVGGVMIAIGLYAVLWGKVKDSNISTDKNGLEELSDSQVRLPENQNKADDIETASNMLVCEGRGAHQFNSGDRAISITENNNPKM